MSVKKHTVWNIAGSAVPLAFAAALIPYTLHNLGSGGFGVLTLVWASIGYFSLFDMGIGRALTFEVSKRIADDQPLTIKPMLLAGLMLTALAGLLGALVLLIIAPLLAHHWLKVAEPMQASAQLSFQITAIGVLATTLSSGIRGALEGMQRFDLSNLNKIALGLCTFALPALAIWIHGPSLPIICTYLVVARLLIAVAIAMPLLPILRGPGEPFSRAHMRPLFNYGFWLTVTGIVGPLMVYGDRFFVSAAFGVAELPVYSIPQEGLQKLLIVPAALCGALLPRLTGAVSNERALAYGSTLKRIGLGMFAMCAVTCVLAHPILSVWLNPAFADKAMPIVFILAVGIWTNSMAMAPYMLLHAMGRPRITAIFHVFELFVYAAALWWLVKHWGLAGAAMAWVLRATLDLILLDQAARRALRETNGAVAEPHLAANTL